METNSKILHSLLNSLELLIKSKPKKKERIKTNTEQILPVKDKLESEIFHNRSGKICNEKVTLKVYYVSSHQVF